MTVVVSSIEECVKAIESSFDSKDRLLIISALADSIARESATSPPDVKAGSEEKLTPEDAKAKTAAELTLDDLFGAWKDIDSDWEKPVEELIKDSRVSKTSAPNFDL